MQELSSTKTFDGQLKFYEHNSQSCQSKMRFSVFLPRESEQEKLPVLYWLSGLTCTVENFMIKAGAQRYAAEEKVILAVCDTSPRNTHIPGATDDWSFGEGAGYYLDATEKPWSQYFQMHTYVRYEFSELIESHFPTNGKRGIFGHSMGGHGALMLGLKHRDFYHSASALAPIASLTQCAWGENAVKQYLGGKGGEDYDFVRLLEKEKDCFSARIDQGLVDSALKTQLKPELIEAAAKDHEIEVNYHEGYDHGYYFVASFIGAHVQYHKRRLV